MPFTERTIVDLREEMARRALDPRLTVGEVAQMFGVSRPTVRLWRERYRQQGRAGLSDRSHAPHSCPHRTAGELEQLIIAERQRWGWGSKKILRRLEDAHPELRLPKRATVDAILRRHDLIGRTRRRRAKDKTPFAVRYRATEPGQLTTIDFKGQFRLKKGPYCYPLTIVDHASRYLLACTALRSTAFAPMWKVLERVFIEHGLPDAIQSDNGPPFGPTHGKFSTLSARLMMLDVQPVFIRPGHPQDNGRHERMHRDLKAATSRPPSVSFARQQDRFDEFVYTYNHERPHEAIDMKRPAQLYRPPRRTLPRKILPPEYPAHFEVRKVGSGGTVSWLGQPIFITEALAGHRIGFEEIDNGLWTVHFYRFRIGQIDVQENMFI
jgi:transposase InsO family protein